MKDDLLLLNVLNKNILTTIVENENEVAFDYCQKSNMNIESQDETSLIELKRRIAYLESENNIVVLKNKSLSNKLKHANTYEQICSTHISNVLEKLNNSQTPGVSLSVTDSQKYLELENAQLKTTINNLKNVIENNTSYFNQKIQNIEQLSLETEQDFLKVKNERNLLEADNQNLTTLISNMKTGLEQNQLTSLCETKKDFNDCNSEQNDCKFRDAKTRLNKKRDLEYELKKLYKVSNIKLTKAEAKIKDLEAQAMFQGIDFGTQRKRSLAQTENLINETTPDFVYDTPKQIEHDEKDWKKILKVKGESKVSTVSRKIRKPKRKFSFESFEELNKRLENNIDIFNSDSDLEFDHQINLFSDEEFSNQPCTNYTRDETSVNEEANSNGSPNHFNLQFGNSQEQQGYETPKF